MALSLDPGVLALLLGAVVLYVRAVRVLARRGVRVARWQQASFHAAITLAAVALVSPVDALGEELLVAHMAQHLLIADLAAPLALVGLRWPVHVFFLPRPVLVTLARRRRLRRALSVLRQPLVATPVYVVVLYGWHFAPLFEGAVTNDVAHSLQHQSFVVISILVWWPAIEPHRRRLRGELWKVGHILGARFAGMMLGMGFIFMREPVYTGAYGSDRPLGFSAIADQQAAGGLMLSLDFIVVVFTLSFFFWRASLDDQEATRQEARAGAG